MALLAQRSLRMLLLGLAPALAVAALASMPVAAQAEPHYYKSGSLIAEGEKVPILEWGTLTYTPTPTIFPPDHVCKRSGRLRRQQRRSRHRGDVGLRHLQLRNC